MKMTKLWITTIVQIILLMSASSGQQLDCGLGGEALERSEHTLTCGGLQAGGTVQWTKKDQNSITNAVASCAGSAPCQNNYPGKYEVTRASGTTSILKILQVTRDLSFIGGDWTCTALSSSTCSITVIYPPDHDGCEVRFDEASGKVLGQCVLHKIYPSPTCTWSEQLQGSQWIQIPHNQTTLTETQFVDSSNSQVYIRATCQLHRPLPMTVGSYSYKVLVIPGHVEPVVNFTSTNTIRLPVFPSLTSSCPSDYVTDVRIANCPCVTSDLGSPPARLAWLDPDGRSVVSASTLTLALTFSDVTAGYNGGTYHCEVQHHTWSSRVPYIPKIAVRPNKPTVNGSNNQTAFSPGQTITLQCTSDGGRPAITGLVLQCPGQLHAPGHQEGGMMISRLTLTLAVSDDRAFCTCIADNEYLTSETAVFVLKVSDGVTSDGVKESDIIVVVAVVGGLVLLVVVVGLVVVLWMRKKKDTKNNTTNAADNHSPSYEALHNEELAAQSGSTTEGQEVATRVSCGAGQANSSVTTVPRSKENHYSELPSKSTKSKQSPTREPGAKENVYDKPSKGRDTGCGKSDSRPKASQGELPEGARQKKKRTRNKKTDDTCENTSVKRHTMSEDQRGQKTKNVVAESLESITRTSGGSHQDQKSDSDGNNESSASSDYGEKVSGSDMSSEHSASQAGIRPSLDDRHEDSRHPREHGPHRNEITEGSAYVQTVEKPTPPPRTPRVTEAVDNGRKTKPGSLSNTRSQEYATQDSRAEGKKYASGSTSGWNYAGGEQSKRTRSQKGETETSSSPTAYSRRTGHSANNKRSRQDREGKKKNLNKEQIRTPSLSQKGLNGNDFARSEIGVKRDLINREDGERANRTTSVEPRKLPIPKTRPSSSHGGSQIHGMIIPDNNAQPPSWRAATWHGQKGSEYQDGGVQPGQVIGSENPTRSPRALSQSQKLYVSRSADV